MASSVFSLVVFLSLCIPRGGGVGIDCAFVCVCDCLCLFVIGFCDVISDLTSPVCVCRFVFCLAVVCACVHAYISVCVLACCSVVASPWSVFLFSGSFAGAGGQALHHASQRRVAPEHPGQAEEAIWRGDRSPAGTQLSYDFKVLTRCG